MMMPPRPMGDPNTARRQQMLGQLLQGGQPAPQAPSMAQGLAGGLQQVMARPDMQKWIMQMFGGARTGGPMQAPALPQQAFTSPTTTPGLY